MNLIQKTLRCVSVYAELYQIVGAESTGFIPEPCKQNPNPTWEGLRYIGDPVSCKWGLKAPKDF